MATLKCGLSCAHCLAVSEEAGLAEMPLDRVRDLIDEVAAMGVGEFLVTGGEPLAREDLGEVVGYLGRKGISWTLNTAALPEKSLREAIARNRPGFVAVSLDGPREVHDAFRGRVGAWDQAMEAIRFFKSLGVRTCAGTTVTTRNYDHLEETFHLAAATADQWGIHLLVPEGRAGARPDLFLSKAQLKRLIKFVARKRRYFRVEMADEIGYLGYVEPLVRDMPLVCGAGRAQCVVLPDGHVVPCTTLDRSCSAGNIHERPFREIWSEGFAELRAWRPTGKCGRCDYAMACKGGCWLQRKAGRQCFKDVWHVPGALKTAAGIAICLGALTASQGEAAVPTVSLTEAVTQEEVTRRPRTDPEEISEKEGVTLDEAILDFYAKQITGYQPEPLGAIDYNDVAWQFFTDFKDGTLPEGISERCAMVQNALETEQHSLSFVALLWRAVGGPLFVFDSTTEYSAEERQMIRDTMAALKEKADAWRLEIFENSLDPYLNNSRQTTPRCTNSKSGQPWPCVQADAYHLLKDLNEERWGKGADPESREAAEAYLLDHHYADQMDLIFRVEPHWRGTPGVYRYSGSDVDFLAPNPSPDDPNRHTLGIFDTIVADQPVTLSFEIKSSIRVRDRREDNEDALLDDHALESDLSKTISVDLTPGREYSYVELLIRIYWWGIDWPSRMARDWLVGEWVDLYDASHVNIVIAPHENGPLLWPAFRQMLATDLIVVRDQEGNMIEEPLYEAWRRRVLLKDSDFWMF
jgi:radical SAM protein with 4Fe4S-binding SPASM domain